jgi:hypothetical protein
MTIHSFIGLGVFDPEAIAVLSEAFEAAVKELPGTGQSELVRELTAGRIIAAANLGERDPARLLIAARRIDKVSAEPMSIGAADRLNALGQLLYGEQWIAPMACDLKIHPDMIAEWAWGRRELSPDHSIFAALAVLVQYHDKGVAKARKAMDRHQA